MCCGLRCSATQQGNELWRLDSDRFFYKVSQAKFKNLWSSRNVSQKYLVWKDLCNISGECQCLRNPFSLIPIGISSQNGVDAKASFTELLPNSRRPDDLRPLAKNGIIFPFNLQWGGSWISDMSKIVLLQGVTHLESSHAYSTNAASWTNLFVYVHYHAFPQSPCFLWKRCLFH